MRLARCLSPQIVVQVKPGRMGLYLDFVTRGQTQS